MEESEFAGLIQPLETFAVENPGKYRFRVAMLAALGYLYLLFIVSVLLTVAVLVIASVRVNYFVLKIAWIPLVLAGLVLRSLWITLPVPDGVELQREQAPALFDLVREVTGALNGPTVHHILVSGDFNASIVQIPQFGMFGWLTNYMVVGLPMLRALDPAQFRAVLAHEVGHLSGKHGRFSGWIYRLRRTWVEILTRVHQERSYASFLFEPFLNWYAPYLEAYSFVLARAQERQADTYSVELAGKEVAAVTLARVAAKDRELSEGFWPSFFLQAKEQERAPRDPFMQMLGRLEQPIEPGNAQRWFFEAMQIPTGYADTHPALADRLEAMGFARDSQETTAVLEGLLAAEQKNESAASYYLRELPENFLASLDRLLREQIAPVWQERHARNNEAKKKLAKLEEQTGERPLTVEEQWERVVLVSQVHDRDAVFPLLETILREQPDHVGANYAMGDILLERRDAAGVAYLEKAMQLDPEATTAASSLISAFYLAQGNKELGESFRKRGLEHFEKVQKQQELALNFTVNDTLIPHELSDEALRNLQDQLGKVHGLREAFLVRKVVAGMDNPFYVLAVHASETWRDGQHAKHVGALFTVLSQLTAVPEPTVFLSLDGEQSLLHDKVSRVPGALIFSR